MPEIDISGEELKEIYYFAIHLAKDAGQILLEGIEERRDGGLRGEFDTDVDDVTEKENAVDIVTKTDNCQYSVLASHVCDLCIECSKLRGLPSLIRSIDSR